MDLPGSWFASYRVDYNGRPSDIYRPITSKNAQLPTEPVKDDQLLSAKKRSIFCNRISNSNRVAEQLSKGVYLKDSKQQKQLAD